MASLEGATKMIAQHAKPRAIIVEKSTLPCRTAQIVKDILELHRLGIPFEILSNPGFLVEDTAIKDLLNPDRIFIGSLTTHTGLSAANALKEVYSVFVDPTKIVSTNLWSSELVKLAANAMLAQWVSSINAISAICEKTGADVDEVAYFIGQDERLGSRFLNAGIGFGGSCFKKDILSLTYLADSLELLEAGEYWMQVLRINELQLERFVRVIIRKLNGNLADKKLIADSPLEIAIFDPQCTPTKVHDELGDFFGQQVLQSNGRPISSHSDAYFACNDATAVIILTEWDQFRYPSLPVPLSAFHEGDQLAQTIAIKPQQKQSEVEVLEIRERKRSVAHAHGQAIDYFNPLSRFEVEPVRALNCIDCARAETEEDTAHENVDWRHIATIMRRPKWVFDGRAVLDVAGIEKLGFRVESIGKASSSSRLNNFG